ncbi:hypothetical protein C8J57DRAFT_1345406 [Mycena rebaudengoi]|nr:hypothetical protein C8J57DRAFT_1345406 [Mycena rebaudengoi]
MTPSMSWSASLLLALPLLVAAAPAPQAADAGCTPLDAQHVQTIPGWPTLKSTAEQNWGTGLYNIVTNDPDFMEQPATQCNDLAKGWVWFQYLETVQGHYKWALNIDEVLQNDADRKLDVLPLPPVTPPLTGTPATPTA